jgi:hypothetical protein
MADERDEIPDEELERMDRYAAEDIVSRESNIGTVARARTVRRLVAALRRERAHGATGDGQAIERAITGALRAAVHDHGPIEADKIGRAVKRVVGNLRNRA